MAPTIRAVTLDDRKPFEEHIVRIRAESMPDDPFTPVTAADRIDASKLDFEVYALPLTEPTWRRAFVLVAADGTFVGHADLKGDRFVAGLHRCELGIGIERPYRRLGFGRRLLEHALDFARAAGTIEWVDLYVFGHNVTARALYESLGFRETGTVRDRFRIGGRAIDDVGMALKIE
jgi:ribosomal protein S18 acetylase RimI-like enzyme